MMFNHNSTVLSNDMYLTVLTFNWADANCICKQRGTLFVGSLMYKVKMLVMSRLFYVAVC